MNNDGFVSYNSQVEYEKGKTTATVIGIILIVLYALNVISSITSKNIGGVCIGGFMIFANVMLMKGYNGWRIFMGVIMSLSTFVCLLFAALIDSLLRYIAKAVPEYEVLFASCKIK